MNILVVSSFLPFPLFSGGHVRLFNILKELSKNHTLTLVCEKRDQQSQTDVEELKKICKSVYTVPRKKQWSLSNILKTGFSLDPFLVVGHTSKEMREVIGTLIKENQFDTIHVETFYVMQNIPKTNVPIVLVEHNIEYLVYERFAGKAPVFLRPLLYLDLLKLKKIERHFWKNAKRLIAVSEEEKQLMNISNVIVVPNGVDIEKFKVNSLKLKEDGEKKVLFIGDFKWIQNKDAASWLIKTIWSRFKSKYNLPNVSLWVVGRSIPKKIQLLSNDRDITFDENAPKDTKEIFKQAYVLVSPVQVGGGTSFKVLESMASGVPVITTSLGIEGIQAVENKEYLLANTTEEFVDKLYVLLSNRGMYEDISKNARKVIEDKYDWKKIIIQLENAYKSAVE